MTGYLVVPTLTALTAENQPFEQFWAASCESWVNAEYLVFILVVGLKDEGRMTADADPF